MAADSAIRTVDDFRTRMQQWVQLDAHIARSNVELRQWREQRTSLMPSLLQYMEQNQMTNTPIQTEHDGIVAYAEETVQPSFTQKFVLEGLRAYFTQKHPGTGSEAAAAAEATASECMEFMKAMRVPKRTATIKRTVEKEKQQ